MMYGWLVVNHFVHAEKFDTLYRLIEESAQNEGILLERKTNVELNSVINPQNPAEEIWTCFSRPDFVLFWDKDIFLCRFLESLGLRVFNSSYAIETCDNKCLTALALAGRGIAMPRTILAPKTFRPDQYPDFDFLTRIGQTLGFPLVVKEAYGSFGFQVHLAHDFAELAKIVAEIGTRPMLFQEFVRTSAGRDVRIQIVGGEVVASVQRTAAPGDFRANVTNGGKMSDFRPTSAQADLALKVCEILRADFAGVDLLFGPNDAPILCEVNTNAHFKNLRDATGIDVGARIFRHIRNTTGI